ncbi:MAG: single-stranded DNA-binding protein [Tannerella sp.]|jgi:single-strand DNA-binding protein|nr:single-stranded DNA-binding protein [Tannerella sp.]
MSLNKAIIIGFVGRDPVIKYFDNGNAVANFSVATSERGYTLSNGIEVPERTEWHNIVANRDRAQFVEKYVKKGSMVYVEGKIRTRNYDDPSGVKHYITEIHADRIEFFSGGRRQEPAESGTANLVQTQVNQSPAVDIPLVSDEADDLPF